MRKTKINFSVDEVSEFTEISKKTILSRIKILEIKPKQRGFKKFYKHELDLFDVQRILNYEKKITLPEIIYITRTTEIYESKLNYLTFDQL